MSDKTFNSWDVNPKMTGNLLQLIFIYSYGGTLNNWWVVDNKEMKFQIMVKYFKNLLRLELNSAINFILCLFFL